MTRAAKVLRQQGVGGLLRAMAKQVRHYLRHFRDDAFDRRYRTETNLIVPMNTLAIENPNVAHALGYQAVTEHIFHRMLRSVEFDARGFTFVDVGSGKGRALMLATRYPFKRILGVEFSRELVDIAIANIERFKARTGQGQIIETLCIDALDYVLPREPLVLFLYNPFSEPVMKAFVARLQRWLADNPRPLLVFYRNPTCQEMFDRVPLLEAIVKKPNYCVYRRRTPRPSLGAPGAAATGAHRS